VQAPLRPQAAAVPSPVVPSVALFPAPEVAPSALARLSAEAVRPALRPAGSEAWAQPVVALLREELAAQDAPVPAEEAWVAVEVPRQAAALPGAVAGQQRAAQGGAVLQPEVRDDQAGALPLAVLPSAVLLSAVLPWAAAWVFRQDQALPLLVPQPMEQFARVTAGLQIASPSEWWWRAATNEVLSWWSGSPENSWQEVAAGGAEGRLGNKLCQYSWAINKQR
jgi:hypothetical protein